MNSVITLFLGNLHTRSIELSVRDPKYCSAVISTGMSDENHFIIDVLLRELLNFFSAVVVPENFMEWMGRKKYFSFFDISLFLT